MSPLLIGIVILIVVLIILCLQTSSNGSGSPGPSIPGKRQDCSKSCEFYETAGVVHDNGKKICYCAPASCNNLPPTSAGMQNPLAKQCTSGLECVNNKCQLFKCTNDNAGSCPFGMSCDTATQKCNFDVYSISGFPDSSYNTNYVLSSDPDPANSNAQGFVPITQQNIPGVPIKDTGFVSAWPDEAKASKYPLTRFTGFGTENTEITSLKYWDGSNQINRTIAGIGAPAPSVTVTKKQ